jgi:hypothetical protein
LGEGFGAEMEREEFLARIEPDTVGEPGKARRVFVFLVGFVLGEVREEGADALIVFGAVFGIDTNPGVEAAFAGMNDGGLG